MSNWYNTIYIGFALFISIACVWGFASIQRTKSRLLSAAAAFGTNVAVKAGVSGFKFQFERDSPIFNGLISTGKYAAAGSV